MKKLKSAPILDDRDFPINIVRRSMLQGTGVDMEELSQKPLIAIANSRTDINPGHMHLDTLSARVRDGDEISIDIPGRSVALKLSDDEIKKRLASWKPIERDIPVGFMRRYVRLVSSAARGAILE